MKLGFYAILLLLVFVAPANAHRLGIFAWLENDQIIVECDWGQNQPASGAAVTVMDSVTKKTLASGYTGSKGRYEFKVPDVVREGHGLLIDVNAGQGHRGEWLMDASELYSAASLTTGFDQARITEGQMQNPDSHVHLNPALSASISMPQAASIKPEDLKGAVSEVLEIQLAPIRKELAAQNNKGPGIVEIIGGLGWIMGFVGIALYFMARKKSAS